MIESHQLTWRAIENGFALHRRQTKAPLLHVVPVTVYPGMWQVRSPDGRLTDMANLTRAKEAAVAIAVETLNAEKRGRQRSLGAAPVRLSRAPCPKPPSLPVSDPLRTPIRVELDEVMRPSQSYSRRPRARALGVEVIAPRSSDAVVCALCRRLVEAGHDPATAMEVYRGQTLALHVRSIGEAAKLTVKETGGRPRFTPWEPFEASSKASHLASDAVSDADEGAPLPSVNPAKNTDAASPPPPIAISPTRRRRDD